MYKSPIGPNDFLRASRFTSKMYWKQQPGTNLYIDPALEGRRGTVYRYVNPQPEADEILTRKRWRFDHPTSWPEKYEAYITDHLFDRRKTAESPLGGSAPFNAMAIYAKCFTFGYASEALWQLNKHKVRLTLTLDGLIRSLATAKREDGLPLPKIYVARARYMDPQLIRDTIEHLRKHHPKKASRAAVPVLLMKRAGFHFENEIRVCVVCPEGERKKDFIELTVEQHGVSELTINPYEREAMAQRLLLKYGDLGVPVARSRFSLDPLSI